MRGARRGEPIAVIDVGSNSVRLVVYDRLARAPVSRFNERRLCGLGREVARSGTLGADGKACTLEALRRFAAIARAMRCGTLDVVATAAIRTATDGTAFVARAETELGLKITVLSGPEEARFGALGILCGFTGPDGVVGDLGGGSVELAAVPPDRPDAVAVSLPLGALHLADLPRTNGDGLHRRIEQELAKLPAALSVARDKDLYVVGGSWRALARARMAITDQPLRVVHGYELTAAEAETLGRTMGRMDAKELARLPGVPRRRAELIPAAGALLAHIVRRLEPSRVVFSATGLREGRLYALLPETERRRDPLLAGAQDLGAIASRDPAIGAAMTDWTAGVAQNETAVQARLREAACHVSDSGWREHPETRAREAFLRLVQYPFLGIAHRERALMGLAVMIRYEGSREDPAVRRIVQMLTADEIAWAETLGETLELGYRVCAGVPAILTACPLDRAEGTLRLSARHAAVPAEDDSIRARLKVVAGRLGLARTAVVTS